MSKKNSAVEECVYGQTDTDLELYGENDIDLKHGFAGGDLDAAEKIEIDSEPENEMSDCSEVEEGVEEEEREVGVDARAGRVDVLLPPLDFDTEDVLKVLREARNKKDTTAKSRKTLIKLISKYENLLEGKYPLGLHKVDLRNNIDKKKEILDAAKRLIVYEQQLINNEEEDSEDDGQNHSLYSKKVLKKRKVIKKKMLAWKVSKVHENMGNEIVKKPEANTSWEIIEKADSKERNVVNTKKRKQNTEPNLDQNTPNSKTKKIINSEFSVIDSKENSFSSLVSSTPINSNSKRVLVKTTSNSHNIQNGSSKKLKKQKKTLSNNTCDGHTTASPELKEMDKGTPICTKSVKQGTGDTIEEKTPEKVSTTSKNNGWGGDWDEPLQEGEYEIFIPNKKYVAKRKSLGLPYPVSSCVQKSAEKVTPINKLKKGLKNKTLTPGSQKKVEFNLSANRSQDYREYAQSVKSTKKQVPFDSSKKPSQGLLKNSTPSPINPFYKKKLKLLSSPSFA